MRRTGAPPWPALASDRLSDAPGQQCDPGSPPLLLALASIQRAELLWLTCIAEQHGFWHVRGGLQHADGAAGAGWIAAAACVQVDGQWSRWERRLRDQRRRKEHDPACYLVYV